MQHLLMTPQHNDRQGNRVSMLTLKVKQVHRSSWCYPSSLTADKMTHDVTLSPSFRATLSESAFSVKPMPAMLALALAATG